MLLHAFADMRGRSKLSKTSPCGSMLLACVMLAEVHKLSITKDGMLCDNLLGRDMVHDLNCRVVCCRLVLL